jgi:hypothetical protein
VGYHSGLLSIDFLRLPSVYEIDTLKAMKGLKPSKSVGLGSTPGILIMGNSTIFVPRLKHVFGLSLLREPSKTTEKSLMELVLKIGSSFLVNNCKPICLLNNTSASTGQIFMEFVIRVYLKNSSKKFKFH